MKKYLLLILFLMFSALQAMQGVEPAVPTVLTQPPRELTLDEKNQLINELEALLGFKLDRHTVLSGELTLTGKFVLKSDQEKIAILSKISQMTFLER